MLFSQHQIEQIRRQSLQMEQEGKVTEEVLQLIYDYRLFHLFVPNELEGRMTTLPEAVKLFQECSRIDGNFGWLITIGAGGGFFASFMSPKVSRDVFAHRTAVIAGSGTPSGTARRVPGGYIVNGSWKYCSGSTHATVFTANVIVEKREEEADSEESDVPEIRSMILLPEQIHIKPDWNAFGLKATSSHSISARDAFVPEEMTFDITDKKSYEYELIYSYPFLAFAQASFAAVTLGIAQHFLEAAEALLEQKPSRHPFVSNQLSSMQEALKRSEMDLYACMNQSWNELQQEGHLSQETEAKVSEQCISTAQVSLQCGQVLFPLLGLSAAMEDSAVNRTWRDLQTACQHALLRSY
ncbi:acyl-CoA dehydrogenase [Paenibacillus dakarensis]|uniref:acyl-CoA dehydrogenase n=1 Tax=Paenibacillus dakarensis TaxID=1527293 RepID=UPI0006D569D8|nr:acyl-CoA dehydrogenase [Paenibacillus dakarensis]